MMRPYAPYRPYITKPVSLTRHWPTFVGTMVQIVFRRIICLK